MGEMGEPTEWDYVDVGERVAEEMWLNWLGLDDVRVLRWTHER
jgi:hypothetical protein